MPTLTAGSIVTLPITGFETYAIASVNNTNFRATFTPSNPAHTFAGTSRSFGPLISAANLGPFGVPGGLTLTVDAFPAGGSLTYTYSSNITVPDVNNNPVVIGAVSSGGALGPYANAGLLPDPVANAGKTAFVTGAGSFISTGTGWQNLGSPVSISGITGVGNVLTASLLAGWSATGFQWNRNGVAISGATLSTYTQLSPDGGTTISVTASGLSYIGTAAAAVPASVTVTVQQFIVSVNPLSIRIRNQEQVRNYIIVRNKDAVNTLQVGLINIGNNFQTQPSTFFDILPGQEYYDVNTQDQVWARPKVNGQIITLQLEVSLPF